MNSEEITIHQPATSKANGSFETGERTISAAPATILMPCSVSCNRQLDAAKFEVIFSSRCRQVRGRNAINNETATSQRPEAVTMMRAMVCTGHLRDIRGRIEIRSSRRKAARRAVPARTATASSHPRPAVGPLALNLTRSSSVGVIFATKNTKDTNGASHIPRPRNQPSSGRSYKIVTIRTKRDRAAAKV